MRIHLGMELFVEELMLSKWRVSAKRLRLTNPMAMSSLVKLSSSSPSSCKYMQSGFEQVMPRRKYVQYFVVPKDALGEASAVLKTAGIPKHSTLQYKSINGVNATKSIFLL